MKINQDAQVKEIDVRLEGVKNLKKRVLIGPEDGSNNIIMRYFRILPQGHRACLKTVPDKHSLKI